MSQINENTCEKSFCKDAQGKLVSSSETECHCRIPASCL